VKTIAILMLLLSGSVFADESQIILKDAPGRHVVVNNCGVCHSTDYIQMNSVFMERKGWEATVNKMIKVMGAPIGSDDAVIIIDYLSKNYGK